MIIKELELRNFRNYQQERITLTPGINLLFGDNAQGKTNLVEAIYLAATGKSFRTNHDRDLVNMSSHEDSNYQVSAWVVSTSGDLQVSVQFGPEKGKRICLNGSPLSKRSELLGYLTVVVFTPEDLNIIKGAPSHRRRFIDMELAQINPSFRGILIDYSKVLQQRNNYLKQLGQHEGDKNLKEVLDQQFTELAARLSVRRVAALQDICKRAQAIHAAITEHQEELSLDYVNSFPLWDGKRRKELNNSWELQEEEVRTVLLNHLKVKEKEEVGRGATLYGPHRDDLNLVVNGKDVRAFGSQGQQRTAALALKLGELEFMRDQTGEYPVLLLDDVLSELDAGRRKYLMDVVKDQVQIIVTTTELGFFHPSQLSGAKIYRVEKGVASQIQTVGG